MARIVSKTGIVAGESFAVHFAAPAGATEAAISLTGGITIQFALEEGEFTAEITSAATLTLPTVTRYAVFVTTPEGKTAVETGTLAVAKIESQYRAMLQAVEAAIASWGSNPNQTISVGEINISYKTIADLFSLRAYFKGLVEEEESGGESPITSGGPFIIGTRFTA